MNKFFLITLLIVCGTNMHGTIVSAARWAKGDKTVILLGDQHRVDVSQTPIFERHFMAPAPDSIVLFEGAGHVEHVTVCSMFSADRQLTRRLLLITSLEDHFRRVRQPAKDIEIRGATTTLCALCTIEKSGLAFMVTNRLIDRRLQDSYGVNKDMIVREITSGIDNLRQWSQLDSEFAPTYRANYECAMKYARPIIHSLSTVPTLMDALEHKLDSLEAFAKNVCYEFSGSLFNMNLLHEIDSARERTVYVLAGHEHCRWQEIYLKKAGYIRESSARITTDEDGMRMLSSFLPAVLERQSSIILHQFILSLVKTGYMPAIEDVD